MEKEKSTFKNNSPNRFWDEEILPSLDPLNKVRGVGNTVISVSDHKCELYCYIHQQCKS